MSLDYFLRASSPSDACTTITEYKIPDLACFLLESKLFELVFRILACIVSAILDILQSCNSNVWIVTILTLGTVV
jgi:hypothetical protein